MDFITRFPMTLRQHDSILVVVEKLSKVALFIEKKYTNSTSEVAKIFIKEIVRLNGLPKTFVSDRDAKFTSRFWKELFAGFGTKLAFTTTYHP